MDEWSRGTEQALTSQGTGLQRAEAIQEVTQNLIHNLLGQVFPSAAGKLLGDFIDSVLYIDRYELY